MSGQESAVRSTGHKNIAVIFLQHNFIKSLKKPYLADEHFLNKSIFKCLFLSYSETVSDVIIANMTS